MRRCTLFAVVVTALISPPVGLAEAAPGASPAESREANVPGAQPVAGAVANPTPDASPVPASAAAEVGWEQFDDPGFDPTKVAAAEASEASERAVTPASGPSPAIVLGPEGVDDQGRKGRLHTVVPGNTLWDLSAAYLGTPWVWPSVWIDNDDIANPHLIMPGDKIWITANEMRVVSDAEAEAFLSPPVAVAENPLDEELEEPAAVPVAAFEDGEPAPLETLSAAAPEPSSDSIEGRKITVSRRSAMGFLSADRVSGSTTIVDSPVVRTYLAEGDPVYLGMGEGEVEVGDEFTIFSVIEEVRDPETNRILGHHVETLGWLVVKELTGDTSVGEIRMSYSEVTRGARLTPRVVPPRTVTAVATPDAIEGLVVFLPAQATIVADGGYVYLNRGELHGVEVGSELEVYVSGEVVREGARGLNVRTPDDVVAKLVVVTVESESSVAFVISSKRELQVGDTVRAVMPQLAQR